MKEKMYHTLGMELTENNLILTHIIYTDSENYSIGDIIVQKLEEGIVSNGLVLDQERLTKIISAAVNGLGEKKIKRTSFSVPSNDEAGIVKTIQVPKLNQKEIKKIIFSSSEDELLHSEKDLYINWVEVEEGVLNEDGSLSILLVGALKTHVDSQIKTLKKSKLKPYFAEVDIFSVLRALIPESDIKSKSVNKLILDMSTKETELIFLSNSKYRYTRPIPFGTKDCISAIETHMEVDQTQAIEEFIKNAAVSHDIYSLPFDQQIVAEALSIVVSDAVESIAETIDFYREGFNEKLDEILITGPSSRIEGICELVEERTGIPTFLGKPYILYKSEVETSIKEDTYEATEGHSNASESSGDINLEKNDSISSEPLQEPVIADLDLDPMLVSYDYSENPNTDLLEIEVPSETGYKAKRWSDNEKKIKIPEAIKSIGLALKEVLEDV